MQRGRQGPLVPGGHEHAGLAWHGVRNRSSACAQDREPAGEGLGQRHAVALEVGGKHKERSGVIVRVELWGAELAEEVDPVLHTQRSRQLHHRVGEFGRVRQAPRAQTAPGEGADAGERANQ